MKKQSQTRLASSLSLLVGVWVLISPLVVTVSGVAFASLIIVGILMILAAMIQLFLENAVPSWVNAVLAAWLLLSAFVFAVGAGAMVSQIIAAVVAFIIAYWDGVEVDEMRQLHHLRAQHQ